MRTFKSWCGAIGFLAAIACSGVAWGACAATTQEDGSVSLENEFVRLAWTAEGRPKEFLYKPTNTEFLGGKSDKLFAWDVKELPEWQVSSRLPRQVKVVKNTPQEAAIEIRHRMPKLISAPKYDQVEAVLVLTVKTGVNAIYGRLTVTNSADEPQTFTARIAIEKYSPNVVWAFYCPDIEGPRVAMDLEPGPFSYPVLSGTLPVACIGGLNEHGVGFAGSFEWKATDMVEGWCSKSPAATLQWAYRRMEIPARKAWSTNFVIACFHDFDEFTTMENEVIGQLMVGDLTWEQRKAHRVEFPPLGLQVGKPVPVTVKLTATTPRNLTVEFGARRLPETDIKVVDKVDLKVPASGAAVARFTWTPEAEGTHVVTARVLEKGKRVALMEKPFVIGATDQAYFAEMPKEEQIGETDIAAQIASPPLHEAATTLNLDAVTIPRKPFGKNFVNGPLSVLFVCQPKHDLVSFREVYHRMDVILDHVVVPDQHASQVREMLKRLERMNPRVLFISAYPWNKQQALSLAACVLIKGHVQKGMGLVMLAPINLAKDPKSPLAQFLKDATPIKDVPFLSEIPGRPVETSLYTLGKGRIALMNGVGHASYDGAIYSQFVGNLPKGFKFWDYGLSQWIKAIHWAGFHEYDLRFEKFGLKEGALEFDLVRERSETSLPVEIRWKLYDEYESEVAAGSCGTTLVKPIQRAAVQLPPRLPGGKYVLDMIALNAEGKTLRWASHLFDLKPEIEASVEFAVKDRFLERGEPVVGEVVLKQAKPTVRTVDVRLEVWDAWERQIRDETRRVSFSDPQFRLPFNFNLWPDARDDRHTLRVSVSQYDRVFHRVRAEFTLRLREHIYRKDFAVGMWTAPGWDLLGYVTWHQARPLEMDYLYGGFDPHQRYYAGPAVFSMGGPNLQSDNKTLSCTPSLCDEKVIKELQEQFAKQVEKQAKGDVRFWMVQDERSFRGEYDYSEPTLAAFRKWQERRYGSLEKMNAAWGTNFTKWEEVRPVTMKEFNEKKLDPDRAAIWLDFRMFMSNVWADWTRYAREVVKRICPDGETGMGGIFSPSIWSGVDYWLAVRDAKVGARYNGMQEECFHSFDPETRVGQWGGYSPRYASPNNLLHPWQQLFHQGHFVWYYKYYANPGGYAYQGVFNCDGTLHGMYNALVKEHQDIKHGIGRLLLGANWLDDGIYLPYSQATIYMNEFLGLPQTVYAVKGLTQDHGYQQRILAYAQIEAGELLNKNRGIKVFFLPAITCLSPGEVENIKKFVRAGGVVVADMLAGVRDDHGNVWSGQSPLDELFGIDRRGVKYEPISAQVSFGNIAPKSLAGQTFSLPIPEPKLKLAGGRAWGTTQEGTPVIVTYKYGAGKALYLNLNLASYRRLVGGGAVRPELVGEAKDDDAALSKAFSAIFQAVLAEAGIHRPRVLARSPRAEGALGESFYWADGSEAMYFGFRPTVSVDVEAQFEWNTPGHIYEMRSGRYYGRTNAVNCTVQPGHALVFSRLPYQVKGFAVAPSAGQVYRAGEVVRLEAAIVTDGKAPGRHVFRIEVTDGVGELARCYTANLEAPNGRVAIELPLALNAASGTWKMILTDAATRTRAIHQFEVVAR